MLIRALLILAIAFAVLWLTRIAGARRAQIMVRWPAIAFAGAALFELSRGGLSAAAMLGGLAVVSWFVAPALLARPKPAETDAADAAALALLGLGAGANSAEIRRAYRLKMARAHPDRGGKHTDAARLTAARDRLLRKRS